MKIIQSSALRAVCAIIVGVLLIQYREQTARWLTIIIGAMFFITGLISCIVYYTQKRTAEKPQVVDQEGNAVDVAKPVFPIAGLGSLILGIILALMPTTFLNGLSYILAAILIIGAISQYVNLATAKKFANIGLFYWIMPTLILITGIIIMVKKIDPFSMVLFIIGWCMLVYGVVECINSLKIYRARKHFESMQAASQAEAEKNQQNAATENNSDSETKEE
jgi:uncharacterized membrane protein HdeD (DUF308 family)